MSGYLPECRIVEEFYFFSMQQALSGDFVKRYKSANGIDVVPNPDQNYMPHKPALEEFGLLYSTKRAEHIKRN